SRGRDSGCIPGSDRAQCDAAGVNGSSRIRFHGAPPGRVMPNGCLGSPVLVLPPALTKVSSWMPDRSARDRGYRLNRLDTIHGLESGRARNGSAAAVPAGAIAYAPNRDGFEVTLYIVQEKVKHTFVEGLAQEVVNEAGNFIHVKPGVPHEGVNIGEG